MMAPHAMEHLPASGARAMSRVAVWLCYRGGWVTVEVLGLLALAAVWCLT